jgi:hypothetical protein
MTELDSSHRIFVSYIDKSREFYNARGYENPYRWAHHEDSPFTSLAKPLSESRVALITTAALTRESASVKEVYSAPTEPPPVAMYTDHRTWDKKATHTRDVESFLPISRVAEFAASGRIDGLSPRFYGVYTDFSQRRTVDEYAPAVLELCRVDEVDVALLIPL